MPLVGRMPTTRPLTIPSARQICRHICPRFPRCREGHAGARRRYPEAGKGRHPDAGHHLRGRPQGRLRQPLLVLSRGCERRAHSDDAYHVGGTNLAVAPSRQHERLLRRRIPGRRRGQRRRRSHVRGSLPVQEIRRKGMRTFFRASRRLTRDSFCTASGSSSPATP